MRYPSFASIIVTAIFLAGPFGAHGADWPQCEKAKLRQLDLQQERRQAAPLRPKKSRKKTPAASVEQLDEWLWKNCRGYSYELRDIEQRRM